MLDIAKIEKQANKLRIDVLTSIYRSQSGHIGGSFSAAEIIAYLYVHAMKIRPDQPKWEERDRLVMSKGHAAPILYAALAERGFFALKELNNLRKFGSILQGHPDMNKTPGVDMSTGSLGQGLSVAAGMALAGRLNQKNYYVYVIIGDGEIEEGEIWETMMSAPQFKLAHLIVFLDHNGIQLDGTTKEIIDSEPVIAKFKAFNWNVSKINGHDIAQIDRAVMDAKQQVNKPTMIVANTIKGKGVSFMENKAYWHGKAPNEKQYKSAMKELVM
jgi:transketolase